MRLRRIGMLVALTSSPIPRHAQRAFTLLGADHLADHIATADDVTASKPDPELVRAALDGVGTAAACRIGETIWDVHAATQAGIPTIGLCTGGYGHEEQCRGRLCLRRPPARHVRPGPGLRLCDRCLLRPAP